MLKNARKIYQWTAEIMFYLSGGRYQLQCFSRLLLHSSFLDWTIVTAFCLDFLPTSSRDSSLFRTMWGSSAELPRSLAFTGCASQSASPSNWLSWRTDPSTALHLPTVVFHPCRRHDIKTTAAVFCLSSSRSTARSSLYSQQEGVPSFRRQHVERPSVPLHIYTVTRGLQTASQDFLLLSFLPGHPDMTYLSLLIIIIIVFSSFFLAFPVFLAIIDII